jgi:hypothetical protein
MNISTARVILDRKWAFGNVGRHQQTLVQQNFGERFSVCPVQFTFSVESDPYCAAF